MLVLGETVRFKIIAVNTNAISVAVKITARPKGVHRVSGEDDGKLNVYDMRGCFLNESALALIDRNGFAVLTQAQNAESPVWAIRSLCYAEVL